MLVVIYKTVVTYFQLLNRPSHQKLRPIWENLWWGWNTFFKVWTFGNESESGGGL